MVILDTCAMIFDALAPDQLSRRAVKEMEKARAEGALSCSNISLWEIAMLMSKGRVKVPMPPREFLIDIIAANKLKVLPITPDIAYHSSHRPDFAHGDPADRIIAATALHHKASLVTCDTKLREMKALKTVW
ncbi:type II toxin-antitoxin system VapC family toxin [Geomonas oryzisoli]|uniref:Type II toxin-antitoxin system VapC family toxin n=1 Tax=Geomonas oryzisoli TaxID=2847992 RepID=A0ABX8J8Y7_9BACT|nr:type II toxin-antitoxin system VapC family toxin [Geomonas oryzisoli]QWV93177.1 type II toxin-antitoxin system VapC family toxin [Geomonas oryzisoli]